MKKCVIFGFFAVLVIGIVLMSGCTNTGSTSVASVATPTPQIVYVTVLATPTPTLTVPVTATPIPILTVTPEKTLEQIPDSVLNSKIQEAKNQLNRYKDTNVADTIVQNTADCSSKISKELGAVIDVNTGDMDFIKGDYGSIKLDLITQNMTKGHTYIIVHSHNNNWYTCGGGGTITLDTFSLADLAVGYNLTKQGYHIQNMIVASDKNYEVHPITRDDWKSKEEVYNSVDQIEMRMEMKFHTEDDLVKYYDVDNLMPILTKELDYVYTINDQVVIH